MQSPSKALERNPGNAVGLSKTTVQGTYPQRAHILRCSSCRQLSEKTWRKLFHILLSLPTTTHPSCPWETLLANAYASLPAQTSAVCWGWSSRVQERLSESRRRRCGCRVSLPLSRRLCSLHPALPPCPSRPSSLPVPLGLFWKRLGVAGPL